MGCAMIWEYELDMAEESSDRRKKYAIESNRKWRHAHPDETRELVRRSAKTFYYRHKNDDGYMEERRETARKWHKRKMTESTPEDLEEYRRKNREKVARFRARQKAKKEQET